MRVRTINQAATAGNDDILIRVAVDSYASPVDYVTQVEQYTGGRVVSVVDSTGKEIEVYDPNVVTQMSPSDPQVQVYEFVKEDFGPRDTDNQAPAPDPGKSPLPAPYEPPAPEVMGIKLNFKNLLIGLAVGYGLNKLISK